MRMRLRASSGVVVPVGGASSTYLRIENLRPVAQLFHQEAGVVQQVVDDFLLEESLPQGVENGPLIRRSPGEVDFRGNAGIVAVEDVARSTYHLKVSHWTINHLLTIIHSEQLYLHFPWPSASLKAMTKSTLFLEAATCIDC